MYNTNNGVKPRFDGKGTEFGKVHRLLPKNCCMFDIDKMKGKAEIDLEIKKQNIAFIEYETDFKNADISIKALFELKYKMSDMVKKAMEVKIGTSTFAQIKLSEKLNARFFIVIANNGLNPFEFYEYKNNNFEKVGILKYNENNKAEKINKLWEELNLL